MAAVDTLTTITAIVAIVASTVAIVGGATVIVVKILRANHRVMTIFNVVERELLPNDGSSLRDKVDHTVAIVDRLDDEMGKRRESEAQIALDLEEANRKRDRIWRFIEDQLIPQVSSLRKSVDEHLVGQVEPDVAAIRDCVDTGEHPTVQPKGND